MSRPAAPGNTTAAPPPWDEEAAPLCFTRPAASDQPPDEVDEAGEDVREDVHGRAAPCDVSLMGPVLEHGLQPVTRTT
ncbi:protein of unknown function [Streptomyces murinus]